MEYFKQYDSGLKLIVKKIDGLLSVTTGILVRTGSSNESEEFNGISHYIEHMMFKGTKKRTAFEISDSMDRIGAQMNAFTTKELTCYYAKSTTEQFGAALDVLSDLFFNSLFSEEEQKKEKGVILEEIAMCEDTPDELVTDLLAESFYGEEGYGRTILGPASNVKKFTGEDIRKFMSLYYTPGNCVVSIAGNVDFDTADRLVEEYFESNFKPVQTAALSGTFGGYKAGGKSKFKDIEQAHISIAMPSVELENPLSNCYSVANAVLGGGMSSRLFQKVREELGLAYSVYSYLSSYVNNGMACVYAGVNPESCELACRTIASELKNFKKNGVTAEEFDRGREQIKGAFIMGQESTSSQMLLYGKYMLFTGKIFDFKKRIDDINAITLSALNDAVGRGFDVEKAATAYVGKGGAAVDIRKFL